MKKIIICVCIFFSLKGYAQSFQWQSRLDSVTADGFYRIIISPDVSTHLKKGFYDLRLYSANEEVPYLLRTEERSITKTLFKEYEIISKDLHPGGISYVTLRNEDKTKIDNIYLVIRNSDVAKQIRLTGSDNQKEWFMIKDDYEFKSFYSTKETSELKLLNFPLSNYEFYRLEINDKKSKPVDILKAGYYDYSSEEAKYTEVPDPSISQVDSGKSSFVKINFSSPQYINQLKFDVKGPAYYLRQGDLFEIVKDGKSEYRSLVSQIEFNSGNTLTFNAAIEPAKELLLQIRNDDNAPLKIKSIKAAQLITYCIAYLTKGKNYELRFGDEKIASPAYDLQYFTNKIPADLQTLSAGKAEKLSPPSSASVKSTSTFFVSRWFIWSAIAIVVCLLAFITAKMLREMEREKK